MTKSTIERALELARDGKHRDLGEIRRTLVNEGYDYAHAHLQGMAIKATIQAAIKAARPMPILAPPPVRKKLRLDHDH